MDLVSLKTTVLWSRTGNQGNRWKSGQIYLNEDGNYRFIFDGVVGDNRGGTIAIDDITSNYGLCDYTNYCDFEQDTCDFTNSPLSDFDWIRTSSSNLGSSTGPISDVVSFFLLYSTFDFGFDEF